MSLPVSHHLEPPLGAFTRVGDLELLLKKYRRLLVRGFDNTRDEEMVRWR
jgi:hypothetical protein